MLFSVPMPAQHHHFDFAQIKEICKVCEESAAGFHFGAYTCEGCKSFFGRMYGKSVETLPECKSGGGCKVTGKQRTACKRCRLEKCWMVGMARSRSRYGRRSHYAKVTRVIEVQQEQRKLQHTPAASSNALWRSMPSPSPVATSAVLPLIHLQAIIAANQAIASAGYGYGATAANVCNEALDLRKSTSDEWANNVQEQPMDLRLKHRTDQ